MVRGRKTDNKKSEVFAIRLTKEQKETLNKNEWLKKELIKYVRDYIDSFKM